MHICTKPEGAPHARYKMTSDGTPALELRRTKGFCNISTLSFQIKPRRPELPLWTTVPFKYRILMQQCLLECVCVCVCVCVSVCNIIIMWCGKTDALYANSSRIMVWASVSPDYFLSCVPWRGVPGSASVCVFFFSLYYFFLIIVCLAATLHPEVWKQRDPGRRHAKTLQVPRLGPKRDFKPAGVCWDRPAGVLGRHCQRFCTAHKERCSGSAFAEDGLQRRTSVQRSFCFFVCPWR